MPSHWSFFSFQKSPSRLCLFCQSLHVFGTQYIKTNVGEDIEHHDMEKKTSHCEFRTSAFKPPLAEILTSSCESTLSQKPETDAKSHFATSNSLGTVDTGATKTVIGSCFVAGLINNLTKEVRQQVSRCPCHVEFRFGSHGTLESHHALVAPIGKLKLKIAIVPGMTPFLLSNTLFRAIGAAIDT